MLVGGPASHIRTCLRTCTHNDYDKRVLVYTRTPASGILDAIEGSSDADSDSIPNYLDLDRWTLEPNQIAALRLDMQILASKS